MQRVKERVSAELRYGLPPRSVGSLLGLSLLLLELVEDVESLVDLGVEGLLGADERQELGVVHLEQHASDLAGEVGVLPKHSI